MVLNSSENEKLFAKSVPISVKDVYTNQSRTSHLFLTMEWQDSCAGMYSRKELVISLTDNDDPFFLYNLHLSDEDFQMLKKSQDLLINFASFPQHIIDYIENCLHEQKNPQPKFVLVFTMNEKLGSVTSPSQLDIIETNQFKNLTHLSLKFIAATESAVRQYLVSCFRNLKEGNRQLQNKLSFLEQDSREKLAACQSNLSGKDQELELLKKELNVQLTMKDSKHALELQEERNRLISKHKDVEDKMERERKEKEHNFKKQIQQLEARVSCLDSLNKELQDNNYKHESTIRELRSTVRSLEDEKAKLKDTIESLNQKCEKLQSDLRGASSEINDLKDKIEGVEIELRRKDNTITRLKKQIESEEKQVKQLTEELEDVKLHLEMKEKTRKILEDEKLELKNITVKLKDKAQEGKVKSELCTKYKATIEEKERLVMDLQKEIAELNIKLKSKNVDVQSLNESINSLQKNINSLEKDLHTKDNVIKYLNRELTNHCIILSYPPPSNLELSPSTVAQKELAKISSSAHRKSVGSDNSPAAFTATNNPAQKTVRIDTSTPTCRRYSSTPARFHMTDATDSAYYTNPSSFTNQATPDNLPCSNNRNVEEENCEIDPAALSAAFGSGDQILKHSTAKKSTKPARSATPKPTKKR